MGHRRPLGCLLFAALALGAGACKDKGDTAKTPAGVADLAKRCEAAAKACGDKDKHVEKMADECKQAATKHVEKGCADKAGAVYDCYAKELCGSGDKIWALDDLRVLAERHKKCVDERKASTACTGK